MRRTVSPGCYWLAGARGGVRNPHDPEADPAARRCKQTPPRRKADRRAVAEITSTIGHQRLNSVSDKHPVEIPRDFWGTALVHGVDDGVRVPLNFHLFENILTVFITGDVQHTVAFGFASFRDTEQHRVAQPTSDQQNCFVFRYESGFPRRPHAYNGFAFFKICTETRTTAHF